MKYVVGDIHGCLHTLKALIEQLSATREDTLIFVGDYINKGPDSTGVIDYILDLLAGGYDVVTLMGNHEDDLLKFVSTDADNLTSYVEEKQGNQSMLEEGSIRKEYLDFFEQLEYYWEDEHFIVAHAGINPHSENPLKDVDALLRIRRFDRGQQGFRGKRIIHGHDPTDIHMVKAKVKEQAWIIPIDSGCVYKDKIPGYEDLECGHLCALRLDDLQLFVQPNIES